MSWIVYEVPPIDFGWHHLKTVKETAVAILEFDDRSTEELDVDSSAMDAFLQRWESAKYAARASGWEGDFRNEPCVFWLPSDDDFTSGFVFKQDNNGTTYVISPLEIPALNEYRTEQPFCP